MNKVFVSLIIPIFNGKEYVHNLIKMLDQQTFQDFEVLFIDDGSSDGTWDEMNKYTRDNIKVIQENNLGVSVARNNGILQAKGKYILFPDADDNFVPTYIEKLVCAMQIENTQMAICGYLEQTTNRTNFEFSPPQQCYTNKTNFINEVISHHSVCSALWNKIFLRSIIETNNIRFDETITIGEDLLFIIQYLQYTEKVISVQEPLYKYYINSNGAMNKFLSANSFNVNWLTEWKALNKAQDSIKSMNIVSPTQLQFKRVRVASKLLFLMKKFAYHNTEYELQSELRSKLVKYIFTSDDSIKVKMRIIRRIITLIF
ncbi:glycosyltransferase [Latilactobacillus curvatus]|uniref:glycosyltransferase family 2 protein n=1 Tax=Latilactobacillus curvatus TaxID=28038 RepID=UPI0021FE1232|nr:glycosyltransferase [Latilactobacillus curvatus]UTB72720.1 hypothetical protein A4W72_07805 [Latilactobacillus curvatus]